MENGQTINKNRSLAHNLCCNQTWKPNCTTALNGQAWSIPASFPKFCPYLKLGPTRRNQICFSNQSHGVPCFYLACVQLPHANHFQSGHTWNLSFSPLKAFTLPIAFEFMPNEVMVVDSLAIQQALNE